MSLTPLLSASLAIQIHVICAVLALLIGPLVLFRQRRDRLHRMAGRLWMAAMAGTALSSFAIAEARIFGPFSPIHIFSVMALIGIWLGLSAIRRGDRAGHARAMRALFAQAMILPAVFTLLPGRRMSDALFPGAPLTGFGIVALLGLLAILAAWRLPAPTPRPR